MDRRRQGQQRALVSVEINIGGAFRLELHHEAVAEFSIVGDHVVVQPFEAWIDAHASAPLAIDYPATSANRARV